MPNTTAMRCAVLFAAGALSIAPAHADDLIRHLNNHVEGTIGAEHLSYSEINNNDTSQLPDGADLDTETGSMLASGLSLGWQGKLWVVDGLRAQFDVHNVTGHAQYNGYSIDLQTGALSPLQASTSEIFTDFDLKLGKGFGLLGEGRDLLTPYAGFGLTAWHRDLSGSPGGYTEQYRHKQWQLGGQYQLVLMKNLVMTADASYGRMFSPRMNASDLPPTFELGSTSIQKYELGFRYLTSPEAYVGLDTYWTHYGYNQSPSYDVNFFGQAGTVLEPTSRTTRDGITLVFGYAYR